MYDDDLGSCVMTKHCSSLNRNSMKGSIEKQRSFSNRFFNQNQNNVEEKGNAFSIISPREKPKKICIIKTPLALSLMNSELLKRRVKDKNLLKCQEDQCDTLDLLS